MFFMSFRVCLMKLGALTLCAYKLIAVISFRCISPFISMKCSFNIGWEFFFHSSWHTFGFPVEHFVNCSLFANFFLFWCLRSFFLPLWFLKTLMFRLFSFLSSETCYDCLMWRSTFFKPVLEIRKWLLFKSSLLLALPALLF
jgi:hypothetical protein